MPGPFDHVLDLLGRWRIASDARETRQVIAARHSRSRVMSKALPAEYRASPRFTVGFDAFPAAKRLADARAARASIARTAADITAMKKQVDRDAAAVSGERRARVRVQVRDVLDQAMRGLAAGDLTAVQVARIEAECGRVLAQLEPGPAMTRGIA